MVKISDKPLSESRYFNVGISYIGKDIRFVYRLIGALMSFMSKVRVALNFLLESSVSLKSELYFIDRFCRAYFGLIHLLIFSNDKSNYYIAFESKGIVGCFLYYLPRGEFGLLRLF